MSLSYTKYWVLCIVHCDCLFADGLSEYAIGFCRKKVPFALSNIDNFFLHFEKLFQTEQVKA